MIQTSPQWVENYIFIILWVPSQSCKKTKFNNGGRPRVTFCHGSFCLLLLSSKCNWVDVIYTKSNCVWCNITQEMILKSCINSWQKSISTHSSRIRIRKEILHARWIYSRNKLCKFYKSLSKESPFNMKSPEELTNELHTEVKKFKFCSGKLVGLELVV